MKSFLMIGLASMLSLAACARERPLKSPDGKIEVGFRIAAGGTPVYDIRLNGRQAIRESRLGIVRRDADFTRNLAMDRDARQERIHNERIRDEYEVLTAKRRHNTYVANKRVYHLKLPDGKRMDILFQVSNDGVAFRYHFPEASGEVKQIIKEGTSFQMLEGTTAFLQPMQESGSGWEKSNPAYEEFYVEEIPVGTQSTLKAGWVLPALFHEGDRWLLISETGLGRGYCGSKLAHESPGGEYFIELADKR
ncbi:MAG: glycoside hydrolase family 97 N-terminal domain-containing protein, partial [Acidobacteria bacterium]|nr:glycoside hydrolase family 97 N-terminal domain-containing protein [Acidobacteriota bacterium]